MKRSVVVLLSAAALTGCAGKIVVTRVPAGGTIPAMNGVYYALPKTVVKVDQPIDRIARRPGKYVAYLPLFFPAIAEAGGFIAAPGVAFELGKAAISTYGEPDPEQIFYLKITGNGPIDRTGLLEYTEQGTVSGVSAQADNATSEIALSVLGTTLGIAAKGSGAASLSDSRKAIREQCRNPADRSIPCRIVNFSVKPGQAFDADALLASWYRLDSAQRTLMESAAGSGQPDFDDALAAYAEIETLRTDRANTRRNPSSLSMDTALKDFDLSIAAALAGGFIGVEKKDTWTYSVDLRDFTLSMPVTILKIQPGGLCFTAAMPSSERPPKSFWFKPTAYLCEGAEGKPVTVSFALNPAAGQEFERLRTAPQTGERGFYYRIPAMVDVVIGLAGDPVTRSRQAIAQFGAVASLPASTGGRSTAYGLKFYEATGALKSFNVTSKAVFQKGTADALGTQAATLAGAARNADDELTKVTRQSNILIARKAIYDNCKALNLACGGFVPTPVQ